MPSTFERVRKVVAGEINVSEDQITLDSSLEKDFGTDSLTMVEIAMNIEGEFNIEIDDDTASSLATVQQIVDAVDARLAAAV